MPKISKLCYRDTVPVPSMFHVARHVFKQMSGFFLHTHRDFAEVFWVESGTGTHLINGTQVPLKRGSLVMIRPKDVHGFETKRDEQFSFVNLSFARSTLKAWDARYFGGKDVFLWSRAPLPHMQEVDSAQIRRLQKWTDYLSTCPNLPFHLDWFLMDLFHSLLPNDRLEEASDPMPEQLSKALEKIREPQYFSGGARRLASLAGYSLQHLNRILKKQIGQSAGEVVQEARLKYAARQLQLTDHKIMEISLDCGCENLGHFYLQFKKKFGITPRQFRLRQQLVVGQNRGTAA
jgi:AraC-like DNA-binding protein